MEIGLKNWMVYTNPNNVTNFAYLVTGRELSEVKRMAKSYPGSYVILCTGKGQKSFDSKKEILSDYKIV